MYLYVFWKILWLRRFDYQDVLFSELLHVLILSGLYLLRRVYILVS